MDNKYRYIDIGDFIDSNDFWVSDVIKLINYNLDYVYKNQTNIKQTFTNLIPYSDFTIISNIDYWGSYMDSNVSITDGCLSTYSNGNVVGVITPAINSKLKAGDIYTLVLRAMTNSKDAILNEFYLMDNENKLVRINHEQSIPYNNYGILSKTFVLSEDIENPRFVIGSSDIDKRIIDTYKFYDRIKDSNMFHSSGFLYPFIDSNKAQYDRDIIYVKDTLNYAISTNNIDIVLKLDKYLKNGLMPSTYYINDINLNETYSYEETLLYYTAFIKAYAGGYDSYREKAIEGLKFIGYLYNDSEHRGIFRTIDNSDEYLLTIALRVFDIITIYKKRFNSYTGVDKLGRQFDIDTIRNSIISYVTSSYASMTDDKYIKGAVIYKNNIPSYAYIDDTNRLSITNVDIVAQLELVRLFILCGVMTDTEVKLKSIMSFEFPEFPNSYLMPNMVKYNDYIPASSGLSVTPMFMYFDIINKYPHLFSKPDNIREDIIKSLNNLKSHNGFYKYDYASSGYIYSSNQYLETKLDGYSYDAPRSIKFEDISLCLGEADGENINVINSTNGDVISKVEYSVKRADFALDEDEVNSIVNKTFVSKSVFSSYTQENTANMSKIKEDMTTLKQETSDSKLYIRLVNYFYDIAQVNQLITDCRNNAVQDANQYTKTISEAVENASISHTNSEIAKLQSIISSLTTRIEDLESQIAQK